ncbi:MAG: nucleotidyl transferase AbiEii/AbiGii toxin family protein, partial [Burkholderiaceae bacterium]
CLSKAHGLIERMSEDVDFKLIVADGLSRSARNKLLSQFKKRLTKVLEVANYHMAGIGISYIAMSTLVQ